MESSGNLFGRYIRQLMNTLFNRDAEKAKQQEKEIDKQVVRLKQMQRTHKAKPRPR